MQRNTISRVLAALTVCLLSLHVWADTMTYGFEAASELNDFTITCENANGSMAIATDKKQTGNSSLKATIGGTGNRSNYMVSTTSYSNISEISFYLASSDKGKTSIGIECCADASFSSDVTTILPLTVFSTLFSNASNNRFYQHTVTVQNVSGYLRFRFCQPSTSGKYLWMDDLVITYSGGGTTPVTTTPQITGFTLAGATGSIDQTNHIIDVTVPNGTSLTSLTPTVQTTNATGYTPQGAQNFSNAVTYSVTDGTNTTAYTVNVSVASATASSDATLSDLKVGGTTISGFSASNTSYSYTVASGVTAVPQVTATKNHSGANISITQATSVNGTATVLVTAEDGTTTKTYTITFSQESTPTPPSGPVPSTDLTIHQPEIYETATGMGGYGTPLVEYNGREYETYYIHGSSSAVDVVTQSGVVVSDPAQTTSTNFAAADGWFIGQSSSNNSSSSNTMEEFTYSTNVREYKMTGSDYIELHVSGYDQFRFMAKDNNATQTKNRYIVVTIDGVQQPVGTLSTSVHVYTYNISTGVHLIRVSAANTSETGNQSRFYAWSLRVSNDPSVRHIRGNYDTQVVNQTKAIEPVTYRMKNGSQGTWQLAVYSATNTDVTATSGLSLTPMGITGDTVQLTGNVMLPVGNYTYRVSAMKNGAEVSYMTGSFSVKTEIFAPDGTSPDTYVVNTPINDAASGLRFSYDAINASDVTYTWTSQPAGMTVTPNNTDKYVEITGTPTTAGSYGLTLSVAGGNSIAVTLNVIYPAPWLSNPDNDTTKVKDHQTLTAIVYEVKYADNVTVSGLPNGLTGNYNASSKTFTISGTANVNATAYPQVFTYTITATGQAGYTGNPVSVTGQITILDPNAKAMLYLFRSENGSDTPSRNNAANDLVLINYLGGYYDVTPKASSKTARSASAYQNYDVILISESVDATDNEVLDILSNVDRPIVNMKAFTYNPSRLDWGSADNGSATNTSITVVQSNHPVFQGLSGSTLNLLSKVDLRGIQCVDATVQGSYCLATASKRGDEDEATFIHEIPGTARHDGFSSRYLLVPISSRSYSYLTAQGKTLLINAVNYVLGNGQASITLPTLQITSFAVDGQQATIFTQNDSIFMHVSHTKNITSLMPVVTLADPQRTHVTPNSGQAVDFSSSFAFPVEYVVSDNINRRVYKVVINNSNAGIEEMNAEGVYFDGQILHNTNGTPLYIYDLSGRRVGYSNSDVNMSDYPRGIYLIQSEHSSMKIAR